MSMNTAENKRFLAKLSMLARECGAGPAEMLATLVQAVFADEVMTDVRLAEFCGMSRTTVHRMRVDQGQRWKRLIKGMKDEAFLAPREKLGEGVNISAVIKAVSVPANAPDGARAIDDMCEVAQGDSRGFKTASEDKAQPLVEMDAKNEARIQPVVSDAIGSKQEVDPQMDKDRVEYFFNLYERVHRVKRELRGMVVAELRRCAAMGYTLRGINTILEDCFASEVWQASPGKIPTPTSFIDWLIQLAQGADGEAHPSEMWREIARSIKRLRA